MILLRILGQGLRILANAAFIGIPIGLVLALLPYFEGASSYPWVNRVVGYDAMVIDGIRSVMPTQLGQLDRRLVQDRRLR